MRVTRNTPEQLIVEDTPWFIGVMLVLFIVIFAGAGLLAATEMLWAGLLFGAVGAGMGMAAFALFVERVMVILDRAQGTISIRRRSIFRFTEVVHALSDLGGAELEQSMSREGKALCRPSLVLTGGMSAGIHPVIQSYTNTRGPRILVAAINDWLSQGIPPQA